MLPETPLLVLFGRGFRVVAEPPREPLESRAAAFAGRCGAAVALAGTALFACVRAGTRLRLRELEATGRRIGRDGSHPSRPAARPWRRAELADEILAEGDSDSCRGPKDDRDGGSVGLASSSEQASNRHHDPSGQ